MALRPKRVFISYSHDSAEHKLRVLELANRLRQDGIDAWIDRYVPFPEEGWPRWMRSQIEEADVVLVVCTPLYKERFDGAQGSTAGMGARWEGLILNQSLYEDLSKNYARFIPILFDSLAIDSIPSVLRPFSYFQLLDQYEALYRLLTDQPEIPIPPIGTIRRLDPSPPVFSTTSLPVISSGASASATELSTSTCGSSGGDDSDLSAWSESTRNAIKRLRDHWRGKELVLVAGAGVSVGAGIPNWSQLVARLVQEYVERTYSSSLNAAAVEALQRTLANEFLSVAPTLAAEFIEARLNVAEFRAIIQQVLYEQVSANPSDLVRSIVLLHRGLRSILAFNIDDSIERALANSGVAYRTVLDPNQIKLGDALPVYHPSGFIPRTGSGSDQIVLATPYHTPMDCPQDSIIQKALRGSTCLFVGISLSDPQLRRMMADAQRASDARRHFYLTVAPSVGTNAYSPAIQEIYQAAYESIGILPIWLESYSEASSILRAIAT